VVLIGRSCYVFVFPGLIDFESIGREFEPLRARQKLWVAVPLIV
jgi:hypothetical protein